MREFLSMGGYAFYVWTSYALAAGVLALNFFRPFYLERRLRRGIARRCERLRGNS